MRKATKKRSASPIKMPKGSKSNSLRKGKKGIDIKIGKRSNSKTLRKGGKRRLKFNSKFLLIALIGVSFAGLVFISAKYIISLRENAFGEKTFEVTEVIGVKDVIQYPGSEFIFENTQDSPTVKAFLAEGNSAYRLPSGTSTEDLESYYSEHLPDVDWELVNTVVLGSEDRKYGQYWVKDGRGLRIYLKFKDVWYEGITEIEAREALSGRVKEEIEREMLMASSEKQDLLPDYPWVIPIPKEYVIRYSATDIGDYREASFQKIGTNDVVYLTPAGYWGGRELDYILNDYCDSLSSEGVEWGVVNSVLTTFRGSSALTGGISSEDGYRNVLVFPNSYNNIVYVLSTEKETDPLFDYIFENIKPLGSEE